MSINGERMRGVGLALAVGTVAAVGALLAIAHGSGAAVREMRTQMAQDVDRGGIGDLARAQAMGRRLVVADEEDHEAAAVLAFVSAVLAVDYGLDTAREAETVLTRAGYTRATALSAGVPPLVGAAWALIRLRAGDREGALHLAATIAAATPGAPYPLYALGRARARSGDLGGAARAMKAAIVGSPGFTAARVGLAEARLDLGDAQAARTALLEVTARAPDDLRARLLLDEAEQAVGGRAPETLRAACPQAQERWPPLAIRAGCAVALASRARREGARAEALVHAEEAAGRAPLEPRLLARTAQILAALGAVDRAATLLDRALRLAAPATPALAWASAAVALGRGRAAAVPVGPRPADPDVRLLEARAALAAGGIGALGSALDAIGDATMSADVDLRLLSLLRGGRLGPGPGAVDGGASAGGAIKLSGDDPVRAYVDGLRARLDGDYPAAAEHFRRALSGHGDACRAAGEYLAMLRELKRGIDPAAWNLLRAENAACVNLR